MAGGQSSQKNLHERREVSYEANVNVRSIEADQRSLNSTIRDRKSTVHQQEIAIHRALVLQSLQIPSPSKLMTTIICITPAFLGGEHQYKGLENPSLYVHIGAYGGEC
jgi:hypothetical protein